MLTLYFLRHGQTNFSKDNRFCGWLDPPLSEIGLQMAQAFAETYHSFPWQALYTSSSLRAQQTAKPLADRTGLALQIESGLREISYGAWEGMLHEEAKKQDETEYLLWSKNPATHAPKGGETAHEVKTRALEVIRQIQEQHQNGSVLLISHKATLRILLCTLLGIELHSYRERLDYPVASLSCVEFASSGPRLKKLGDVAHLPQELQNQPGT